MGGVVGSSVQEHPGNRQLWGVGVVIGRPLVDYSGEVGRILVIKGSDGAESFTQLWQPMWAKLLTLGQQCAHFGFGSLGVVLGLGLVGWLGWCGVSGRKAVHPGLVALVRREVSEVFARDGRKLWVGRVDGVVRCNGNFGSIEAIEDGRLLVVIIDDGAGRWGRLGWCNRLGRRVAVVIGG